LDQRADENGSPGCPRNDDRHPGRLAQWGDSQARRHRGGSTDRARQQRGGASLNAEPGCLKIIDAARNAQGDRRKRNLSIRLWYRIS
jgi:hypothetical protein